MERVERKDLSGFVVGVDGGCSSRSAVYFLVFSFLNICLGFYVMDCSCT
jgi:hypothetical protein